jgi:hypothetical protein
MLNFFEYYNIISESTKGIVSPYLEHAETPACSISSRNLPLLQMNIRITGKPG